MNNYKKRYFEIETFKHRVVVDPEYADETWKILEHAFHEIYNLNASDLSFAELYSNAYNMVFHRFGEKLYSGLVTTMTAHLQKVSRSIESSQGVSCLEELNRKWNDHNKALQMLRDVLTHMDKTFVRSNGKTPVYELGLNLWRDNVIHSNNIQTRLLDTLLELIRKERTGEVINRRVMGSVIKMLMELGPSVYKQDFERHFLSMSIIFYLGESQRSIECCSCADYLKKAERFLNEETERVSQYLDAKTETKILKIVEIEMISNHMLRLIHKKNTGLVKMLIHEKYEDLGRMYNLFSRVEDGLTAIRDLMSSHIRDIGKKLVTDPDKSKDPIEFVQRLLNERDHYNKIITSSFNNDKTFQNALNSSFEHFINLNSRSPEFISLFIDDKLRKGLSEDEVEVMFDKVLMLFRHLQEKDVFEKYYRQHLAKLLRMIYLPYL